MVMIVGFDVFGFFMDFFLMELNIGFIYFYLMFMDIILNVLSIVHGLFHGISPSISG